MAKPRGASEARPRGLALLSRQVGALEDYIQRDASSLPTQAHGDNMERREVTGLGPEDVGEILSLLPTSCEALGKVFYPKSRGLRHSSITGPTPQGY